MTLFKQSQLSLLGVILFFILGGCTPNTPLSSPAGVKILTSEEGIYRVTAQELGWSEIPAKLHLTLRGDVQPFWIEQSAVYFYAPEPDSLYTNYNSFILVPGQGESSSPTETYQASLSPPNDSYTAHLHLEQNDFYEPLAPESSWLGQRFIAPQTIAIPFTLDNAAAGAGTLQAKFWGSTQASSEPNHHIQISINENLIADQTWNGKIVETIAAKIPENVLHSGENTLEITAPGDIENIVDITFLDWVEITYPREAQAQNDVLFFEGGDTPLRLTRFGGDPVIFDVTSSPAAKQLTAAAESIFQGEPDHHYIAVGSKGYLSPSQILPLALTPNLKDPSQGADYLVIGPDELLANLEPLIAHRQAQGLLSQGISAEAIYDQFGDGFPDPMAIRRFLQHAAERWNPAPRYILLVGDATYDPKGYKFPTEGHILPTCFVDTIYGGQTSSDIPLSQLNDSEKDPWPDIAIGRIPVRTAKQARIFVEKTIAYEETPPASDWRKHIVAVADGQEDSFKTHAQTFLEHFHLPYQTTLIAPEAGNTTAAQEIQRELEEGVFLMAYFGHGSMKMWSKDQFFTSENAAELKNTERLPIILNFTCLAGFFTHPEIESLTESLLWNPQGGAVAVLAPSSLTLPTNQNALSDALAETLLSSSSPRLGDIVLQAWRQIPADSHDVMQTFMLFGDPALQMVQP